MPDVKKIGLKGFSAVAVFPNVEDTEVKYSAAGEALKFIGASEGNFTDNREEFTIPGDDGVYDSGSEWTYTDVEVTVHEIDLAVLAQLAGCSKDEVKTTIEEGVFDIPTTVALVYRALRRDGGYRCYRYYNAKLLKYSVEHKTKGSSSDGQPYKLAFRCTPRAIDGKIRGTEDVKDAAASATWLASIPTVTPA